MAAAPLPRVRVANWLITSRAVVSGRSRLRRVFSWTGRLSSPATTTAYRISPESIIAAASSMPLRKPRQALAMSKLGQELGRPSAWCTPEAVDGSRYSRLTEVLTSSPISAGSIPLSLIALAPAIAAPSTKVQPSDHQRRSRMPARRSSKPGRRPTRR